MKQLKLLGLSLLALGLAVACNPKSDDANPTAPPMATGGSGGSATTAPDASAGANGDDEVRKGERGSSCDSTNDCADDLSCVVTHQCPVGVSCANKSCQPSNFDLMGTGKRCYTHECAAKADCCGDMPQQAPAKCTNRNGICNTPSVAGCTIRACTAKKDCGNGSCPGSTCSQGGGACLTTADCALNTCDQATLKCTVTQTDCSVSACLSNLCPTSYCNCTNPDYLPTSPICTDEDCEGICGFTCEDERCIVDKHCGSDAECPATTPFCVDGVCGECVTKDDCEMEECVAGHCGPECANDTQCKLFEACQAGSCAYVGCRSDRECVLAAGNAAPAQDPRLAKCQIENERGTCVFPCDIDAQCAASEVCLEGVCRYIGCETNQECKTIVGLHNLPAPTPERPWVTSAECRPDSVAKP